MEWRECTACWVQCVSDVVVVFPKDRKGEKSNVNWLWWTAAINQVVRLFIEKTAAGTRIINTVSVLCVNHKESIYSILLCSVLLHRQAICGMTLQYKNIWQERLNPCCLALSPRKAMTLKKIRPAPRIHFTSTLSKQGDLPKYQLLKMFSWLKIFPKEKRNPF